MNKVILMGRLTRDPEVRYSQGASQTAVARFSVAVDRRFKREGEPDADFFNCTCFGKQAEFVERYLHKGTKVVLSGRVQNDNYTNKDGQMVYSVRIMVDEIEFAESKNAAGGNENYRLTKFVENKIGGIDMAYNKAEKSDAPMRKKGGIRRRKKVCVFCGKDNVIDYKDTNKLKRYVSERGKILPRRITGNCAKHQRALTVAIKRARHVALMPYVQD